MCKLCRVGRETTEEKPRVDGVAGGGAGWRETEERAVGLLMGKSAFIYVQASLKCLVECPSELGELSRASLLSFHL